MLLRRHPTRLLKGEHGRMLQCWCPDPGTTEGNAEQCPTHGDPGELTIRELTDDEPVLNAPGCTFDTALPQDWWDSFYGRVGKAPHGFVWFYPPWSIWGEPYPLTPLAAHHLAIWQSAIHQPPQEDPE